MSQLISCEVVVVRYVPNVVRDDGANIGVILMAPDQISCRVVNDWSRVLALDPAADVQLLSKTVEALTADLRLNRRETLDFAQGFSLSVQLTRPSAVLTSDPASEIERLAGLYLA